MHVQVTEKNHLIYRVVKLHVRFYNRMSRLQRHHNENWHAHYSLCQSLVTNASKSQEKFKRGLATWVFLASVVSAPHDHMCLAGNLTGFDTGMIQKKEIIK